jgi:hypothetical protein
VVPDVGRVSAASDDLRTGIVLFVVSALLLAAGLLLERAGIDPGRTNRGNSGPTAAA